MMVIVMAEHGAKAIIGIMTLLSGLTPGTPSAFFLSHSSCLW